MAKSSSSEPSRNTGRKLLSSAMSDSSDSSSSTPLSSPPSGHAPMPSGATAQRGQEVVVPVTLPGGQRIDVVLRIDVNVTVRFAEPAAQLPALTRPGLSFRRGLDDLNLRSHTLGLESIGLQDAQDGVAGGTYVGGTLISGVGDGGGGTVTIGLFREGKPVLLTAAHVVSSDPRDEIPSPLGTQWTASVGELPSPVSKGTVKVLRQFGGSAEYDVAILAVGEGTLIDTARVRIDGAIRQVSAFGAADDDLIVHHGGIVSPAGIRGKIVPNTMPISNIKISNRLREDAFAVFAPKDLFCIQRIDSNDQPLGPDMPFARPGDSGAPVVRLLDDGTSCKLVGMLVAVDDDGIGYAHRMVGDPVLIREFGLTLTR